MTTWGWVAAIVVAIVIAWAAFSQTQTSTEKYEECLARERVDYSQMSTTELKRDIEVNGAAIRAAFSKC